VHAAQSFTPIQANGGGPNDPKRHKTATLLGFLQTLLKHGPNTLPEAEAKKQRKLLKRYLAWSKQVHQVEGPSIPTTICQSEENLSNQL